MTSKAKTTKPSDPDAVNDSMRALKHPLKDLAGEIRQSILKADAGIGEEIKWNAPAFFYTGAMAPFDPKEYRRHLIVFNLFRKDSIRLVFWRGDRAKDTTGFLTGEYADGRRLAALGSVEEFKSRKKALVAAVKAQLKGIGK